MEWDGMLHWHLLSGFLRHVSTAIGSAHSESTIQHSQDKRESIALITSVIEEGLPDEVFRSITGLVCAWRNGDDQNGCEPTAQDDEYHDEE